MNRYIRWMIVALALGWTAGLAAEEIAVVSKCKGTVQIKAADQDAWHTATLGEMLTGGMLVLTGDDGYAVIKFLDDKSFVKILPRSGLKIDAKREGRTLTKELYLKIGSIFTDVEKGGRKKFSIETATSLASVKGTRFWMSVDNEGFTVVVCLDGAVDLHNKKSQKAITVKKKRTGYSSDQLLRDQPTKNRDVASILARAKEQDQPGDQKKKSKQHTLQFKLQNQQGQTKDIEFKLREAD